MNDERNGDERPNADHFNDVEGDSFAQANATNQSLICRGGFYFHQADTEYTEKISKLNTKDKKRNERRDGQAPLCACGTPRRHSGSCSPRAADSTASRTAR